MREIMWTEEAEAHIWKRHKVTAAEVEQIVYTQPRLVVRGTEDATLVYGTTDAGRYLLVVLAEALDGRFYVATAREMTDTERSTFRRKRR